MGFFTKKDQNTAKSDTGLKEASSKPVNYGSTPQTATTTPQTTSSSFSFNSTGYSKK